ncbi:MAG: heparinase II/III family protein [Bacteroidales bacterium]|nr:heparinase II/III family protein [Bacteroidales bacterium]
MKNILCIGLLILLAGPVAQAQWKNLPANSEIPEHPRLLLLKGEEQKIRDNIAADPVWAKVHQAIISESDRIIQAPVLTRIQVGKRLLSVAREALRRLFFLSYSYRMTTNSVYLVRAEKEMLAIASFSDWNPSHFLDVAEMTMGMAIGYDWLFDTLPDSSRRIISEAILKKGLNPAMNPAFTWYLTATHNWNQVCNAGITYGALAIHNEVSELANYLIDRGIESIKLPMKDYEPDGAYPEGYGYWDYGTTFNVLFISAIEKIFGTDFGLADSSAFLKTAGFKQNMLGATHLCYNFCDSGLGGGLSPAMFWFAARLETPALLWNEKYFLENRKIPTGERILPALMLWGSNMKIGDVEPPQELLWTGHGTTPVALMRTSWTAPDAIYVGFKGGTASSNHAHMDAGSFIMEADGIRWACDFGMQDYNSLESRGVDLWNRAQNSQRWEVFRYNNMVHNTLTVDNRLQNVAGHADIVASSETPDFINAKIDLSAIYKGQLAGAMRGIAIINGQYVTVRDEFRTLDRQTVIRWTMLTTATAKLKGKNTIELTKGGKKLRIEITAPVKIAMKTWDTTPLHDYDAPNPGTCLTGFEAVVPANTDVAWTVNLIPSGVKKPVPVTPKLSEWPAE